MEEVNSLVELKVGEEVEVQVFGQDQEEYDDKQAEQRDHLLLLGFEEEEEVEVQDCY